MGIIFGFSAQTGDVSKQTSGRIEQSIEKAIEESNWIKRENKHKWKENVTVIVRKTAHFTIYTILGICVMGFCGTFEGTYNRKQLWLMAISIGVIYAMSDELHQRFVSDRSAEWRDVGIDTMGVLLGTSIMQGIHRICEKKTNKKGQEIV